MDLPKSQSSIFTAAAALQSVLYGLWPVLLVYTITLGDYSPEQLSEPLFFVGLLNLSLWTLLFLFKMDAARAAFIVSLFSLANFFYLPFSEALTFPAKLFPVPIPDVAVFSGYFVLLSAAIVVAALGEIHIGKKTLSINFEPLVLPAVVIAAALCCFNVFTIAKSESHSSVVAKELGERYFPATEKLVVGKNTAKPDVYYVVIDGFANPATLKNILGYDNSNFVEYLEQNDFYVAHNSCSNHDRTVFSVTSSLNMGLMSPVLESLGRGNVNSNVPLRLLRDNKVMKLFKRAGYRIVNVCSGFCPTDYIEQADVNVRSGWGTGFNMSLLHLTMLGALEPFLHTVENEYANVRTAPIRRAAEIAALPGPKFVLIHCLLTHPPFIFDEYGRQRPLTKQLLSAPYVKEPYVGQLKFAEKNLKELLNTICCAGDGESIVILQSDHGSACTDWHNASLFTQERMRILNAYRVPDSLKAKLYQTITPVNTFRVVLNDLFGANVPMQKDESYIAIPPEDWRQFQNCTDRLSKSCN